MTERTYPRGAELWRLVMDSRLHDVHTALPGKVTAFDASAQTVDVQPMVKNVLRDREGAELVESYPQLRSVPVVWPRCGKYLVAFPLEAGDFVTLIFNEWPIDYFLKRGDEAHPINLERHGLSGPVAYPGGPYPTGQEISETVDALLLGHDGGALVKVKSDGTIELGASGATLQPIALADDVKSEISAVRDTLNSLITAYNSHIHITTATVGATAVPGVISPTVSSASPPAVVGDVGSSKVEVEE